MHGRIKSIEYFGEMCTILYFGFPIYLLLSHFYLRKTIAYNRLKVTYNDTIKHLVIASGWVESGLFTCLVCLTPTAMFHNEM